MYLDPPHSPLDKQSHLISEVASDLTDYTAHSSARFSDLVQALEPSLSVEEIDENHPDLGRRLAAQLDVA